MPAYDYQCQSCKREEYTVIRSYEERNDGPECCGEPMKMVWLQFPSFKPNTFQAYDCPITGAPITTEAAHRNNLATHGCQQYDPEMRKDAERYRKSEELAIEKMADEIVSKAAAESGIYSQI